MYDFVRIKDLQGFHMVHDFYWVNKKGEVYSEFLNDFLKPHIKDNLYIQYKLKYEGIRKWKHAHAHRLVAMAYIPNPNNLPVVNHINENRQNNNVDNLEWCTQKHNMNVGTVRERLSKSLTKDLLYVYDYKGDEVLRGFGVSESSKKILGFKDTKIKNRRAGDYFFLDKPATPELLNEITKGSKSKTLIVRDIVSKESTLFPNQKEVKEFLGNTINVSDAVNKGRLTKERYKIEIFDFNEKDSPNLCEYTSIRSEG